MGVRVGRTRVFVLAGFGALVEVARGATVGACGTAVAVGTGSVNVGGACVEVAVEIAVEVGDDDGDGLAGVKVLKRATAVCVFACLASADSSAVGEAEALLPLRGVCVGVIGGIAAT